MTAVLAYDSDKYPHELWAQQQAASCAVASIWMARNEARQSTSVEEEWALAWKIYNRVVLNLRADFVPSAPAPRSFDPRAFQSNNNTFANKFSNYGTFMK